MSLQIAANHLAAQGRGNDSTLVHMSPKEVKSLQELAMAHGGSLTINPQTGLPEAGFLSNILPLVAGVALTAMSGGTLTPLMSAMIVGGGTTVATGSLKKGLMAGFGAYGGAGLGAGLLEAGAAGAVEAGAAGAAGTGAAGAVGSGVGAAGTGAAGIGAANAAGTGTNAALDVLGQPMTGAAQAQGQNFGANMSQMGQGISNMTTSAGARNAFMSSVGGGKGLMQTGMAAASPFLMDQQQAQPPKITSSGPGQRMQYNPGRIENRQAADVPAYGDLGRDFGRQRQNFNPSYSPYNPPPAVTQMPLNIAPQTVTEMPNFAGGGPIENLSNNNALGGNTGFPMANIQKDAYANAIQQPIPRSVVNQQNNPVMGAQDTGIDQHTGEELMAGGGLSHLGDYSDGGRLLRGPGDGVSDSIPAMIGQKQPARLADGEFVVPARIVSELGNGSTESGARKLYAMMDRVQKSRRKTVGANKVAVNSRADKYLPA